MTEDLRVRIYEALCARFVEKNGGIDPITRQALYDKAGVAMAVVGPEMDQLRARHQADIFRLEQWRTDVTATNVKLRAEIEAFADVLVRGSGSVPAVDVAWKLRQILATLDTPAEGST